MKKFSVLFFVLLGFVSIGQDVSQWRGINRDGVYASEGLLTAWPEEGPELLWHYDELGDGHGSAAVSNSMVYISGTEGEMGFVLAFDLSGALKWKTPYGKEWYDSYEGVRTSPCIVDGKLYIMSGFGIVSCMDAINGSVLWQVDILNEYKGINLKWGITENLLVYDDIVVCTPGGTVNNVLGLNRHTGEMVWSSAGKGEISAYCSPALIVHNGRKIVVTHTEKSVLGIDGLTGTLLWSVDQPNRWSVHANTPLYENGLLYCVSGYGKGSVMLKISENGNEVMELWRDENLDNKLGGVVLLNERIYGSGDFNKNWYALDWYTGQVLHTSKELKKGNIITSEGMLFWYSQSGEVAMVEPQADTFNIISKFKVPFGNAQHWAHLVIDKDKLFVRHGNSLMVYKIGKKKLSSEWRGIGRTGSYPEENNLLNKWPENGPVMNWFKEDLPSGYSSIAVTDKQLFTTGIDGDNDVVICYDLDGNFLWKSPYGRKWDNSFDESRSTPTIEDNRLYVSSGLGDVSCLNTLDGTIIWQVKASEIFGGNYGRWGIAESILIVDGVVIYTPGGDKTTMVALDKLTGETIWQTKSLENEPSYTSPLLIERNGEKIIATLTQNYFIGVLANSGEILWNFDFGAYAGGMMKANNQTNTPLYHDGEFFLTSGYDHQSVLVKLGDDNRSISLKWVDSELDVHHGGVVLIDGYIYGSNWLNNRNGNWTCLRWEDGKMMYSENWENKGAIIHADDHLYCYDEKNGNLALVPVNPEKFEVSSSFTIPYGKGTHWSHPVIKNGQLYIRHGNALMSFNIKEN